MLRGCMSGCGHLLVWTPCLSSTVFEAVHQNLTYLLQYPDRELVLRKPPAGMKAASAHDMKREFLIQSRLQPVYPLVPSMIAFV